MGPQRGHPRRTVKSGRTDLENLVTTKNRYPKVNKSLTKVIGWVSSILGRPGQTRAMFQASTTRRPVTL